MSDELRLGPTRGTVRDLSQDRPVFTEPGGANSKQERISNKDASPVWGGEKGGLRQLSSIEQFHLFFPKLE
jgi:hypothetical protein